MCFSFVGTRCLPTLRGPQERKDVTVCHQRPSLGFPREHGQSESHNPVLLRMLHKYPTPATRLQRCPAGRGRHAKDQPPTRETARRQNRTSGGDQQSPIAVEVLADEEKANDEQADGQSRPLTQRRTPSRPGPKHGGDEIQRRRPLRQHQQAGVHLHRRLDEGDAAELDPAFDEGRRRWAAIQLLHCQAVQAEEDQPRPARPVKSERPIRRAVARARMTSACAEQAIGQRQLAEEDGGQAGGRPKGRADSGRSADRQGEMRNSRPEHRHDE